MLVGVSAAIRTVEEEVNYAARSGAKVLITGESGTGKEIVARLIHARSTRRASPLVTLNCAGLPDTLLESELFGHVRGSFTDAHRDKSGWLERANGGTIFMDEVAEMSLRMQALLLRFLETGEIQRVGADNRHTPLDVRVIAATHRKLIDHVAEKTFREDLFYRLNVIHVEVPPLRERREDVFVLLRHFFQHFSTAHQLPIPDVSAEAIDYLTKYTWPGNVRELRNIAERLILRSENGSVHVQSLPREVMRDSNRPSAAAAVPTLSVPQTIFERILKDRASFWAEAYEPFMARNLTRADVRELIRLGLDYTCGNYKLLVSAFNMRPEEYKKFMNFLHTYQCHVPFQGFRIAPSKMQGRSDSPTVA
jgi:transcriptional regulator with PAS, ATPase and Fis domain